MSDEASGAPRDDLRHVFSASGSGFFTGGERKAHLEQLRHLSQWSRRVLLVTGPRGIGKSTLYRQLSASLEPRAHVARVNGALAQSAGETVGAIVQGLGLAASADADTRLLAELVGQYAGEQERAERFCAVLVDDAELLQISALEMLVSLAAAAPLRVVLFGEPRLTVAVERVAEPAAVEWHEMRLAGLAPGDVHAYLDWRFRQQGYSGRLPFSDAQIREIARLSEGLPGRIDQMANVLLAKLQASGEEQRGRRFPPLHRALLAVLVVVLAFAYAVWQPAQQGEVGDSAVVEQVQAPPVSEGAEPGATEMARLPQPEPEPKPAPAPALEPEAAPAAERPAPAQPEPAQPEPEQPEPEQPEPAQPEPAQPGPEQPEPARTEPERTEPEQPDPQPQAAPAPQARPQPAPGSATSGIRQAGWIMRQPASAYTLQLISFSSAERAAAYVARQEEPAQFARFRQQQSGRILHVVIYGSFQTREAAAEAAAGLPASFGAVKPWVRSFGQVQDAVRTALQP